MSTELFVYGVLMFPKIVRGLTGKKFASEPATLADYERLRVQKKGYPEVPAIVPKAGAQVAGILLHKVDDKTLFLLDEFEEVLDELYVRSEVEVVRANGQAHTAEAYLAGPEIVGHLEGAWNPDTFAEGYFEEYLDKIIPQFLHFRK